MYIVKYTHKFKKQVKLMLKQGKDIDKLVNIVDLLKEGKPLDAKYRSHDLIGGKKGLKECHIEPDWLLIYLIDNDMLVLTLIETGSHSDILKK